MVLGFPRNRAMLTVLLAVLIVGITLALYVRGRKMEARQVTEHLLGALLEGDLEAARALLDPEHPVDLTAIGPVGAARITAVDVGFTSSEAEVTAEVRDVPGDDRRLDLVVAPAADGTWKIRGLGVHAHLDPRIRAAADTLLEALADGHVDEARVLAPRLAPDTLEALVQVLARTGTGPTWGLERFVAGDDGATLVFGAAAHTITLHLRGSPPEIVAAGLE